MKKYLKSKVDLEVILQDNTWFFEKGTIFIFESVGWSVEYIPSYTAYIKTECMRLNKVIYNKMIFSDEITYEVTELEENIINTMFKYTSKSGNSGTLSSYKVTHYTALEIIKNTDIFEDAIDYKRDETIHHLIK